MYDVFFGSVTALLGSDDSLSGTLLIPSFCRRHNFMVVFHENRIFISEVASYTVEVSMYSLSCFTRRMSSRIWTKLGFHGVERSSTSMITIEAEPDSHVL
jgi:hypothetical protein